MHPDVRKVLRWAKTIDRPLPWRGERDPYRVLVSEVMLQQTQASRVGPVYERFLRRFRTVESLARAQASDVIREWGDLGYNRRALHLWRAARAVVERGSFPETVAELEQLPGVGPYTARAVASFAFGRDVEVVEANVRRILVRAFALETTSDVQRRAEAMLPKGRAAAWNQALMDLGALVCRPRSPRCAACPLKRTCAWSAGIRPPAHPRTTAPPPFETTSRFARGRVVEALRSRPRGIAVGSVGRRTGLGPARVAAAIDALERDGLVTRIGSRVHLGSGAQRARARSSSTSGTR